MKKIIIVFCVTISLLILTSCSDPRTVADDNWEDMQVTLIKKYQESYRGNVYNFFKLKIDGDIITEKVRKEIYYAYSEGDLVSISLYKAYNADGGLLSVELFFKIPKDPKKN